MFVSLVPVENYKHTLNFLQWETFTYIYAEIVD